MSGVTLTIGLLVPWLAGIASVAALPGRRAPTAPGELAWIAGTGYLVGAFLLTLWMRALSFAGIPFGWLAIALPLALLAACAGLFARRRDAGAWRVALRDTLRAQTSPPGLAGLARHAWWALLAWIALRFLLLALEVSWQPLYPWNAWTQWATKARVWFELRRIVPFEGMESWFAADGAAYFDAAPGVPPTMPLLQAWASIALGALGRRADELAVVADRRGLDARRLRCDALARHARARCDDGRLPRGFRAARKRSRRAGRLRGPAARGLLCVRGAGAPSLRRETKPSRRHPRRMLALACTQIATSGLGWAATLVPGVVAVLVPGRGVKAALVLLAATWLAIVVLAQSHPTILGYSLHLAFDPDWPSLAESYFLLGSWNLLWYAALAVPLLAWRDLASPRAGAVDARRRRRNHAALRLGRVSQRPRRDRGSHQRQSDHAAIRAPRGRLRGARVSRFRLAPCRNPPGAGPPNGPAGLHGFAC